MPLADLASVAENYGQLTGVLAGFAFTALVLLLTPAQGGRRTAGGDTGVPLSLFVAFIALILATLLYSVLAGENMDGARARAATAELVDGLVFGLAVVTLLQGVTLLLREADIDPAAVSVARFVTVVAFPTIATYFIAQGAPDTLAARAALHGGDCTATGPALGVWLTAGGAVVLTASLARPVQRRLAAYAGICRVAAPLTVFLAAAVAAMVSGDIATRTPTFLMSPLALSWFLVLAAVLLTVLGLMFSAAGATAGPVAAPAVPDGADRGDDASVAVR
ncbi:hypothetical protein L083_4096 [Actinoplanes sp. N902-109]|nr:hypothetical protein L083_4096 [Actinoplanes sp. N902-109]